MNALDQQLSDTMQAIRKGFEISDERIRQHRAQPCGTCGHCDAAIHDSNDSEAAEADSYEDY